MSKRDELINRPIKGQEFDEVLVKYGYRFDEQSQERVFGAIGTTAQQKNIQSELASCDYSLIMANLTSSLDDFDMVEFVDELPAFDPADPMSLLMARENAELAYQKLPKEVKAKYENNPRKFAAALVNGEFGVYASTWQPSSEEVDAGAHVVSVDALFGELEKMRGELAELRSGARSAPGAGKGAPGADQEGGVE